MPEEELTLETLADRMSALKSAFADQLHALGIDVVARLDALAAPVPATPEPSRRHIAAALAKAQISLVDPIANRKADVRSDKGAYSYEYADLSAVLASVRPALSANGIALTSDARFEGDFVVVSVELIHGESGETLRSELGWRMGPDIQKVGGTITYLRRYLISLRLCIATDKDDDGNAASGRDAQTSDRAPRGQGGPPPERQQRAPRAPANGNGMPPREDGPPRRTAEGGREDGAPRREAGEPQRENGPPHREPPPKPDAQPKPAVDVGPYAEFLAGAGEDNWKAMLVQLRKDEAKGAVYKELFLKVPASELVNVQAAEQNGLKRTSVLKILADQIEACKA